MKTECIRIFRMKRVSVPLLLTAAGYIAVLIWETYCFFTYTADPLNMLNQCLTPHILLSVIFLYTSYEIFYDSRHCGLEETVSVTKFGRLRFFLSPLAVQMVFLGGIFFLLTAVPAVAGLTVHMPLNFYAHVFWVNLLNTFLAGTVFILIGGLLGICLKRIQAYIVMVLIIFLVIPFTDSIPGLLDDALHINLWPAKTFFSLILPPHLNWVIDYQYGVSCEPMRWNLVLFWICLLCTGFVCFLWNKRPILRGVLAGICTILAGINLIFYVQGGSLIDLSESPTSVFRPDQIYYNHHAPKEEEADFTVVSYDMDLRIDRKIHGEVVMRLDGSPFASEYPFTLFRTFDIAEVKDETGKDLPFTRDGDYFTVFLQGEIHSISVRYSGYSPVFYSNEQAVCLPSCFPYYPWAGYKKIYFLEPDDEIGLPAYIARTDLPLSDYSVRISGVRNLQTNLTENNGAFLGKTNGLSVLGGFIEAESLGPYRVITESLGTHPATSQWLDQLQSAITELENNRGITDHIRLSDYIIMESGQIMQFAGYDPAILMSDHIFLWSGSDVNMLARFIVQQKNDPILLTSEEYLAAQKMAVNELEGGANAA